MESARPTQTPDDGFTTIPTPPPALADILNALLKELRNSVTTLALAFKPPLTAAAVKPQLEKIEDHIARMVSCVLAASGGGGGHQGYSMLIELWSEGVGHTIGHVNTLLSTLKDDAASGSAEAKVAKEQAKGQAPYLAQTGMVWASIDDITIPRNEIDAVKMVWDQQKSMVRDAWDEFKDMLEGGGDGNDDLKGIDDEWADLENFGGKMNASEQARTEAVSCHRVLSDWQIKPLLALHQILHATLPRYLNLLALAPEETYGVLLYGGEQLVAAADNAVSVLHPKHDVSEINEAVGELNKAGKELATTFRQRLQRASAGKEGKDREVALNFVQRWEAKLSDEIKSWEEKRMSVGGLADAL